MKLKIGKKSGLKYFGIQDIRAWQPCYDPSRYLAEDWRGTAVDILKDERIPHADRLWVVLRPEIMSERAMRLFAVWCARQVVHLNPDPRVAHCIDVAERYANGQASEEERAAAAGDAASAAAAGDAAWAAWAAAAGDAARDAAWAAAWAAAQNAQVTKLIEMLGAEGEGAFRPSGGKPRTRKLTTPAS